MEDPNGKPSADNSPPPATKRKLHDNDEPEEGAYEHHYHVTTTGDDDEEEEEVPKCRRRGLSTDQEAMTSSRHIHHGKGTTSSSMALKGNPTLRHAIVDEMTEEFTLLASPRSSSILASFSPPPLSGFNKPEKRSSSKPEEESSPPKCTTRRASKLTLDIDTSGKVVAASPRRLSLNVDGINRDYHHSKKKDTLSRSMQEQYKQICSRVTEYLFVGGLGAAENRQELLNAGITHILNCAGTVAPNYYPRDFQYLQIDLNDHNSQDITCHFYNAMEFIEHVRTQVPGGKILLHCIKGISRSPTMAMAYLIWKQGLSFDESFRRLKEARPVVNPNPGFIFQISEWSNMSPLRQVFRLEVTQGQAGPEDKPPPPPRRFNIVGPICGFGGPDQLRFPKDDITSHCYLFPTAACVYIWLGPDASLATQHACPRAVAQLALFQGVSSEFKLIRSGAEPAVFWTDVVAEAMKSMEDR